MSGIGLRLPQLSLAPMVDVSSAPYRLLNRLASRDTTLYTEMLIDQAILHAPILKQSRALATHPLESAKTGGTGKLIAQIGGSQPEMLVRAARALESSGRFDGLNVNMGCPADSAQSGLHGAVLMQYPEVRIRLLD